jgi:Coenzyme PQQ synthesis protein D (PqqD)
MLEDSYIARGLAIASRQLGGDVIILPAADPTLFSLNETAASIWLAADGQTRLRDIVECVVMEQFEVDRETALRDAEHLVNELASHGVLRIAAHPFVLTGDKRA